MYVQGTCAYQVYLTFSLVSIFGQWFGIILWSKKIRHTLLCPCSEWRVRTLTGNHEANRLGVTSSCTRVSSLVGPVRLQSSIVSVACGNQWYSTRPVSACWKSKATTRCEFVLQLQLVFEVALTVPWLYENGNLSVFRMWAHQKGPIWLDARAPALEFSGYCFWSWHQLWGSCEGGERSCASEVLKDVSKCLTSLQTNVYMLHLISITLSSLHPFKLQEVATIPCQLPNSRTNLQCRYTSLPALLCGSWPQRLAGTFPPT